MTRTDGSAGLRPIGRPDTIRITGGVALFLFGTTYLWLTREFASAGLDTSSLWWAVTEAMSLVTVAGFTVATWGLFKRRSWWAAAALASAVLGMAVLTQYWIAAQQAGETTPWFTVLVHVLGCVGVLCCCWSCPCGRGWTGTWLPRADVGGAAFLGADLDEAADAVSVEGLERRHGEHALVQVGGEQTPRRPRIGLDSCRQPLRWPAAVLRPSRGCRRPCPGRL